VPDILCCTAEDLTKENLATLQEICKDEFELSPSTELVYSALATRIRERIEKSFDSGKGWNVVVGRSFGAFVTQKIKCYAYLSVYAGVNVLAWKS